MNDGKDAEKAFEKYWDGIGHCQRFRDKRDLMGINKNAKVHDFPKPADFMVSSPRHPIHYAEVKSTVDPKSFSFNKIRDAQHVAALKEAKRGDGSYKFYIFSYPLGKWFIMTCHEYIAILEAGRKSVNFEELRQWNMT